MGATFFFAAAILLAQVSPAPVASSQPAPLKVIERLQVSPVCTLLHQNIVQSVYEILRNDAITYQIAAKTGVVASSVTLAESDSPLKNPGVVLGQVRWLELGTQLEQNLAQVDRLLSDPRFTRLAGTDDAEQEQLRAIRESLERVAVQQRKILNIVFGLAQSEHPEDMRSYGNSVEEEVIEEIRRARPGSPVSDLLGDFGRIVVDNHRQTHQLEDVAASAIQPLIKICK